MSEQEITKEYKNKQIKDLKSNISYYQCIIGEAIAMKEKGLDFEKLFEYALIVMSKQGALIELLEKK